MATATRELASSSPIKPLPLPAPVISGTDLSIELAKDVSYTTAYFLDVLLGAIHLLRRPLSVILFLYLLALLIGRVPHALKAAVAPLCVVPGISNFAWCHKFEIRSSTQLMQWADYPKLADMQSAAFEQLLDQSVHGPGLSFEIKKAEIATTDLITLIRVSDLKSRDMLAELLVGFVEDARITGRGLQRLSSKIGGTVDSCVHKISALPMVFIMGGDISGFLQSTITRCIVSKKRFPKTHLHIPLYSFCLGSLRQRQTRPSQEHSPKS
jgi:hypothetical protein